MRMRDGIPFFRPPVHLAPTERDGPVWLRNTYAADALFTRRTGQQLAIDTGHAAPSPR